MYMQSILLIYIIKKATSSTKYYAKSIRILHGRAFAPSEPPKISRGPAALLSHAAAQLRRAAAVHTRGN